MVFVQVLSVMIVCAGSEGIECVSVQVLSVCFVCAGMEGVECVSVQVLSVLVVGAGIEGVGCVSVQVLRWLQQDGQSLLERHSHTADNLKAVKGQQKDFEKLYFSAMVSSVLVS